MGESAVQYMRAEDREGRPILRPVLHHFGIATTRHDEMVEWYRNVLGLVVVAQARAPLPPATFVTNDDAHHRGGFFSPPTLRDDPEKLSHPRVQHLAWEYASVDDLLESWERIAALGIHPVSCWSHGPSFAIYYKDPDQNTVELLADSFGDHEKSLELVAKPEWIAEEMQFIPFDPARLLQARDSGLSLDELREHTLAGDYAPEIVAEPQSIW